MLKFFRKIRHQLLIENKTGRYFKYAIGEIALVVIGILIALQINNWNEARKDKVVQLHLLKELQITAQEDFNRNQIHINRNKECLASLEIVITHLENRLPFHDSLSYHFAMAHNRWISQVKDNAYENAKKHGLDFIANDTTKNLLTHLYENRVQFMEILDERFDQFYYQIASPELANSFNKILPQGSPNRNLAPLDYNALLSNSKYINVLKSTRSHLQQYVGWQQITINGGLNQIQHQLDSEIERY